MLQGHLSGPNAPRAQVFFDRCPLGPLEAELQQYRNKLKHRVMQAQLAIQPENPLPVGLQAQPAIQPENPALGLRVLRERGG